MLRDAGVPHGRSTLVVSAEMSQATACGGDRGSLTHWCPRSLMRGAQQSSLQGHPCPSSTVSTDTCSGVCQEGFRWAQTGLRGDSICFSSWCEVFKVSHQPWAGTPGTWLWLTGLRAVRST